MRIDRDHFIFTPYRCDYSEIDYTHVVEVKGGKVERGKVLPIGAEIHLKVYEKHPGVHTLMTCVPAYGMAYAVTDSRFNTYADFEIFFSVHRPAKLPFGATGAQVADAIDPDTPVVLVENDYALTLSRGHGAPVIALSTAECLNFMGRSEGYINVSGGKSIAASMTDDMDAWYDTNIRSDAVRSDEA